MNGNSNILTPILVLAGCAAAELAAIAPSSCPAGEILDGEVCVPAACGVGVWGGKSGDVYVDAAAASGGDGSAERPLTSIQAGVDLAGERGGGLVAVAGGTYVENVAMAHAHDGVELVGRCQELVTIDGSGAELPGISVDKGGTTVAIAGVTVTGAYFGLQVYASTVTVDASGFLANRAVGVLVNAYAVVALTNVRVWDTDPVGRALGRGVEVGLGAALTATGCSVRGNTGVGVIASGAGTTVRLVDTDVHDTVRSEGATGDRGVEVSDHAVLTATRCSVQRNAAVGVYVSSAASAVLVDTIVLDTLPGDLGGGGIYVQYGGRVSATGCAVRRNAEVGVFAANAGTTVDLVDTAIVGSTPNLAGFGGRGIQVQDGAALTAAGCIVQKSLEVGVFAGNDGTTVDLLDSQVLDTDPGAEGTLGRGIAVQDGAALTANGCTVEGNTEIGVFAAESGTTADLVNTDILGTRRGQDTAFALGVSAQQDALVRVSDGHVAGNYGPGAYVWDGGHVEIKRVQLTGNQFAGVVVAGGSAAVADTSIADTSEDAEWGGGFGVYANDVFGPGVLSLTHSTIGPHRYAAVWLDGQGAYDIADNTLSGSDGILLSRHPAHGNAVFAENGVTAWNGTTGLLLARNTFTDASLISVLLHDASAMLVDNIWAGNTVDLRQQRCTEGITPLTDEDLADVPTWLRQCPDGPDTLVDLAMQFTSLYLAEVAVDK